MLTQEQLQKERERLGIPEQGVVKKSSNQSGTENIARMQLLASEFDKSKQSRLQETGQDISQMFSNIKGRFSTAGKEMEEAESNIDQGVGSSLLQQFGSGAKAFSGSIGDLFAGAVKGLLSQDQEDAVKNKVSDVVTGVVENPAVSQGIKTSIESFNKLDPTTQKNLESIFNVGMLALDIAGAGAAGKTVETGVKTAKAIDKTLLDTAIKVDAGVRKVIGKAASPGKEILERAPRFIDKTKQKFAQSAERAERIKAGSPSVQTAIKSNLDDKIINTVVDADNMTLKSYKEIVDIAGDTSKKLGIKKRPEIVAGNAVSDQYKLIVNQRKNIGKQIGAAIDKLSKNKTISMTDEINSLKRVLIDNGGTLVSKNKSRAGGWVFRGKITRAEANKINELWSEIQKGSKGLSPREVRDFDQLFSKLQRETRLEGIGAIRVDTPDGNQSLFSVFRDVFSKKLDTLSPEIRTLNKEYRDVLTLMDDIDNSIIKSGNFDATKGVDVAEFAQTNLRRMLSDAQSAAAFREIAQKLDDVARQLGYTGATPEDLITFATEMRTLFPDAIPATSFTGGIKIGVKEVATGVLKAGTPDITDQQKALKGLIDSLLSNKKPVNFKGGAALKTAISKDLTQEARKYKSADEFVESKIGKYYHGTPGKEFKEFKFDISQNSQNETRGIGVWVTNNKEAATSFSKKIQDTLPGVPSISKDVGGTTMDVVLNIKNPKIFKPVKGGEELLTKIEELKKQKPSLIQITFTNDPIKRNDIIRSRDAIEKQIKTLRKQYERDSFQVFMDERDKFAKYISEGASWEERYIALDPAKTNMEFTDYLKSQGYDSIIIKNTRYDASGTGSKTIDQISVFDPKNVLTKSQLTDIWNKATKSKQ